MLSPQMGYWQRYFPVVHIPLESVFDELPMKQTLPVLFVNMDNQPQRRRRVESFLTEIQGANASWLSIERFPACSSSCDVAIELSKFKPEVDELLQPGELGCYASHVKLYRQVIHDRRFEDDDFILILEDDVMLHPSLDVAGARVILQRLVKALRKPSNDNVMMVQLGTSETSEELTNAPLSSDVQRLIQDTGLDLFPGWGSTTHAYMMRKRGMKQFLRSDRFFNFVIDIDLRWFATDLNLEWASAGAGSGALKEIPLPPAIGVDLPYSKKFRGMILQDVLTHGHTISSPKYIPELRERRAGHLENLSSHRQPVTRTLEKPSR